MSEFTIRNKTTYSIMTLTPGMLAKMLNARPESVRLALTKTLRDYKKATGMPLLLDYKQRRTLLARAGADARGVVKCRYLHSKLPQPLGEVMLIFTDGFLVRPNSEGMSEDLALAESFHALLDTQLTTIAASESEPSCIA